MAFFTRVNMPVPVLPVDDDLSSECSTLKRGENTSDQMSSSSTTDSGKLTDSREVEGREFADENCETQRFHYVVDRVLGVEVWRSCSCRRAVKGTPRTAFYIYPSANILISLESGNFCFHVDCDNFNFSTIAKATHAVDF